MSQFVFSQRKSRLQIAVVSGALALSLLAGLSTTPASAEHFDIKLTVIAPQSQADAFVDTTPPVGGVNPRPVVTAHPGDQIRVSWRMKSNFPHGVMKNAGVHFFVVKEAATGQKPVPDPSGTAGIIDTNVTMDFNPTSVATGSSKFVLKDPGSYLVRIQSEDTHQEHDHEHFSAIDIEVR